MEHRGRSRGSDRAYHTGSYGEGARSGGGECAVLQGRDVAEGKRGGAFIGAHVQGQGDAP